MSKRGMPSDVLEGLGNRMASRQFAEGALARGLPVEIYLGPDGLVPGKVLTLDERPILQEGVNQGLIPPIIWK